MRADFLNLAFLAKRGTCQAPAGTRFKAGRRPAEVAGMNKYIKFGMTMQKHLCVQPKYGK